MIGLYVLGMALGVLGAVLLRGMLFQGEATPFVLELPNYRLPGLKNVARLLWDKARDFLQRAFTVILIATIVIWFLQTFDFPLNMAADSQSSMLAAAAGKIAPILAPLGLGDWRISTALISGFMAKESVVSTLSVLLGAGEAVTGLLSPLAAASMLVFCLLYTPCVAAVAAVRRELGGKWATGVVVGQCLVAYAAALLVRLIGLALGFT